MVALHYTCISKSRELVWWNVFVPGSSLSNCSYPSAVRFWNGVDGKIEIRTIIFFLLSRPIFFLFRNLRSTEKPMSSIQYDFSKLTRRRSILYSFSASVNITPRTCSSKYTRANSMTWQCSNDRDKRSTEYFVVEPASVRDSIAARRRIRRGIPVPVVILLTSFVRFELDATGSTNPRYP